MCWAVGARVPGTPGPRTRAQLLGPAAAFGRRGGQDGACAQPLAGCGGRCRAQPDPPVVGLRRRAEAARASEALGPVAGADLEPRVQGPRRSGRKGSRAASGDFLREGAHSLA